MISWVPTQASGRHPNQDLINVQLELLDTDLGFKFTSMSAVVEAYFFRHLTAYLRARCDVTSDLLGYLRSRVKVRDTGLVLFDVLSTSHLYILFVTVAT